MGRPHKAGDDVWLCEGGRSMARRLFPLRRALLASLGVAAAGISFGGLEGCADKYPTGRNGEEQRLNLYNWDTYTGKTTLSDFKAATGIGVHMSLFPLNDELFSKLRAGNPGF